MFDILRCHTFVVFRWTWLHFFLDLLSVLTRFTMVVSSGPSAPVRFLLVHSHWVSSLALQTLRRPWVVQHWVKGRLGCRLLYTPAASPTTTTAATPSPIHRVWVIKNVTTLTCLLVQTECEVCFSLCCVTSVLANVSSKQALPFSLPLFLCLKVFFLKLWCYQNSLALWL